VIESSDLRLTKMPLNSGSGYMPALGFGTLIPDPAVTITATRDALNAGFRHSIASTHDYIRISLLK
jgi:alcohol dehydrogenase (NADP+)